MIGTIARTDLPADTDPRPTAPKTAPRPTPLGRDDVFATLDREHGIQAPEIVFGGAQ
jgi:hypothetical protein